MRKKILFILLSFSCILLSSHAQKELKFGHINTQELMNLMPETDSAKMKLQRETKHLEEELDQMQVELNKKYNDYLANRESLSKLVRDTKEAELQEMQQRLQNFQMSAENELQNLRTELFKPIYDKVNKAIEKVGKANNFTYIFDSSVGAVLYYSEQSIDIMPLLKKELGLK